jgi:hypothetical protein
MAPSIATQTPNFHSLSPRVPVGYTQIFVASDYAGTITSVTRVNDLYWSVSVRDVRGAFRNPKLGASSQVWFDVTTGEWVADYSARSCQYVEAGRAYDLRAALADAIISAAERGHDQGLW